MECPGWYVTGLGNEFDAVKLAGTGVEVPDGHWGVIEVGDLSVEFQFMTTVYPNMGLLSLVGNDDPANNASEATKQLKAIAELELATTKLGQRLFIGGGMVFSGAIVAGAGVVSTIGVCATGVGCLASPITVGVALAGGGLALEGVYYGFTGTFWNPSTGKSCGPNGCN